MTMNIGVTCDEHKAHLFRAGILNDGYKVVFDGLSKIPLVHLFSIEVLVKDYEPMLKRIGKTVERIEAAYKQAHKEFQQSFKNQ
jgi:hypothetical protein